MDCPNCGNENPTDYPVCGECAKTCHFAARAICLHCETTVTAWIDSKQAHPEVYGRIAEEYAGRTASHRRQTVTVVAALEIVHGPKFPNRNIVARALVEGKRGARYEAYINRSGHIGVI